MKISKALLFTIGIILTVTYQLSAQNLNLLHPVVHASGHYFSVSVDKSMVACASNSEITIFDTQSGNLLKDIAINNVKSVAFSNDNKYIAVAYQNYIQINDYRTDEVISKIKEGNSCSSIIFSPNNETVAYYTGTQLKTRNFRTGKTWLVETSNHKHFRNREAGIESDELRYSPDGRYLLTVPNKICSPNDNAAIWDTKMKVKSQIINIAKYPLFDINTTWTEISLFTVENKLIVKDLNTGQIKKTIPLQEKFTYLKYVPGKDMLLFNKLSRYSVSSVYLVNPETGERSVKAGIAASQIKFLDENRIITNKEYVGLKVFDLLAGQTIDLFKTKTFYIEDICPGQDYEVFSILAYTSNLRLIDKSFQQIVTFPNSYEQSYEAVSIPKNKNITVTCGSRDVYIWDNNTGAVLKKYEGILVNDWNKVISGDGEMLFQYSRGGCEFSYFDLSTGLQLYKHKIRSFIEPDIYSGAFYPDSKYFVTGVTDRHEQNENGEYTTIRLSQDKQKRAVRIWDLGQKKLVRTFLTNHPNGTIQKITFSHNGDYIFTTSNNEAVTVMWDLLGNEIRSFKGRLESLSFDDKFIVVNLRNGVSFQTIVYDVNTGETMQKIPIGGDAYISKDGKHIINNLTSQIEVWSMSSGQKEFSYYIVGDTDWVAISPDGYYDGTENGLKEIHYSDGFKVYPVDISIDTKYQPGMVKDILQRGVID